MMSLVIGVLIFLLGVVIVISPARITDYLRKYKKHAALHIAAVIVRLLIGILLVGQADSSKFPQVIKLIGGVSIIAAVVLWLMGSRNFNRLMSWTLNRANLYMRAGGLIGVVLGAFIAFAFYK